MAMDKFFESKSTELGQLSFAPLGGELFDFGNDCFDFETVCKDSVLISEDIFEGISPTFFEDACFLDKDFETSFKSNEGSVNSLQVDETFGAIAGDNIVAGVDIFSGLNHGPFGLGNDFDFDKLTNDNFLWPSKDIAMAEPTTTTQSVTSTRPTPSKAPKTLTKEAKVTKTPKKPKKATTPKKAVTPKKAAIPRNAATPKKGLPAIAPRERSLEELSNVPWCNLTQQERERLLLPMIRGTEQMTGAEVASPDASLTGPILKSPGLDLKTGSVQTPTPTPSTPATSYSSPWEALTMGIHTLTNDQIIANLLEIAVIEGYHKSGNKTTTTSVLSSSPSGSNNGSKINMIKNNSGIKTANASTVAATNNNVAVQSFGPTNVNTTTTGQSFTSPSNTNNIMAQAFKTPMPPAVYGITRQQEALKKHAELQAQGRRR